MINAPFEALWSHTQDPALHERWDLRFTRIAYLPRPDESQPQRFTYETRIGFGLRIVGTGESVGTHDTPTESTSALKFGSDDPKSLIREGSGYWKYIRTASGIRFLTLYDYKTRFGGAGRVVDRLMFRPMLGWATAWSFDRVRLWLERGIDPGHSATRAAVAGLSRIALATMWFYLGLVPKLILMHPDEFTPLLAAGFSGDAARRVVIFAGWFEMGFAILLLIIRHRMMFVLVIVFLILLCAGAAAVSPEMLLQPFNPLSLTIVAVGLAAAGFIASHDLPSARRCRRTQPGDTPS